MIAIILLIFCCCLLPAILGGMYMYIYSEDEPQAADQSYEDYDISDLVSGGEIQVDSTGSPSGTSDEKSYYLKNGIYSIQSDCDDPSIGCGQHLFYEGSTHETVLPRVYLKDKPGVEWEINQVPGKDNVHNLKLVYRCEPEEADPDCFNHQTGKQCEPDEPDPNCGKYLGVVGRDNNIRLAALSKAFQNHNFAITPTPKTDVYRISPDSLSTKLLNMARHSFEGKHRIGFVPDNSNKWKIIYKRANHPIKPGQYYIQDGNGCINTNSLCSAFLTIDQATNDSKNLIIKRGETQLWTINPVDGLSDIYSMKLNGKQVTRFANTNRLGLSSNVEGIIGIKIVKSPDYKNYYTMAIYDADSKAEYPITWESIDQNKGRVVTGDMKKSLWNLTAKEDLE